VVVAPVERFEILRVVREQDDRLLCTPPEEFDVVRVFPELVFRLNDVVSTFVEQSFEDSTNVFVQKNPISHHRMVSFGFSEESRTRSNASSFSRWRSRISST
jgi:hypothetical protein